MATATPYRWAKSAPPGSTLCPYCEVVYSGVGNGTHCATCGTKLVMLHTSLVTVGETGEPSSVPATLVHRSGSSAVPPLISSPVASGLAAHAGSIIAQ